MHNERDCLVFNQLFLLSYINPLESAICGGRFVSVENWKLL